MHSSIAVKGSPQKQNVVVPTELCFVKVQNLGQLHNNPNGALNTKEGAQNINSIRENLLSNKDDTN